MSTAVMTMQQHRPMPAKKMVMMLSPPHEQHAQIVQPSNGACVIVSSGYSPPHFTNLDAAVAANNNNNTATTKAKNNNNNNLNKVSRVSGGAVQKVAPRTSVVVPNSAAAANAAASAAADALRCKRRIQFSGAGGGAPQGTFGGHQTASVARRNARERNRVKQVNNGFATLRSHIPPAIAAALQESSGSSGSGSERSTGRQTAKEKEAAKKLSKVETLRMAVEYIRRLQALLNEGSENADPGTPVTVKSESVLMPDSPHGFDADYETALALSHYSMASTPATNSHPINTSGSSTASTGSLVGLGHHHHQQQHQDLGGHHPHHFVSMSPPCSDAGSAGSPTPSYVSDGSAGASSTGGYAAPGATTFVPQHHHHHQQQQQQHLRPTHLAHSPSTPPDSTMYEPMSPEDEELLDVISWWQQSN